MYRGRARLAKVVNGSVYYYHNDQLGTPELMTNSAGTVVWEAIYKPFGEAEVNPGSSQTNHFRFQGQYYDSETGFHYNHHRYYDPKTGRYLTPDPIGPAGGINPYLYVENDPVNRVDPSGLWDDDVHSGIGNSEYGTFLWATQVGFADSAARRIAIANAATDKRYGFAPILGVQSRHFDTALGRIDSRDLFSDLDLKLAIKLHREGGFCESYATLGRGLHSVQDKYAHMAWIPIIRHPSWYDDATLRKDALSNTEKATKEYLQLFLLGISR